MAFYFSGSCVVLGAFILFLLTLPCWNKKHSENDRPDVHYTSNCDKVASVAWIWAPFIRTQISPLLPSNCPLMNYTWTTSRRNFLSLTIQGFPPYFCCQVLIYQNICQRFWNTGLSSVLCLRFSGSNHILQIFLKVWLWCLCWFFIIASFYEVNWIILFNSPVLHCVYVHTDSHFTVALKKDMVPFITLGRKTSVKLLGVNLTQ